MQPLSPSAHDYRQWASWDDGYLGKPWRDAPFLWPESYFYRRLLEAVGFFSDGVWCGVDPFAYLQSDVIIGLTAEIVAALDAAGQPWRTDGSYGGGASPPPVTSHCRRVGSPASSKEGSPWLSAVGAAGRQRSSAPPSGLASPPGSARLRAWPPAVATSCPSPPAWSCAPGPGRPGHWATCLRSPHSGTVAQPGLSLFLTEGAEVVDRVGCSEGGGFELPLGAGHQARFHQVQPAEQAGELLGVAVGAWGRGVLVSSIRWRWPSAAHSPAASGA
jgi:hypothetical protein